MRRWGRLSAAASLATLALIVLGGVVRITGSGLGCGDDWPLCNGQLIPPMDLPTLIEYGHRLAAAAVSVLVAVLAVWGLLASRRGGPVWVRLRWYGLGSFSLVVVQILLGAVTVRWALPPASVILHLGTAMLLLATLLGATCESLSGRTVRTRDAAARVALGAAALSLLVVLAGALVANLDAAFACQGFPLCNGDWLPANNPKIWLHWTHRTMAYVLVFVAIALPGTMRRLRPRDRLIRWSAVVAAVLATAQLAVAADMILRGLPSTPRVLHVALGASVFAALVVVASMAGRRPDGEITARISGQYS